MNSGQNLEEEHLKIFFFKNWENIGGGGNMEKTLLHQGCFQQDIGTIFNLCCVEWVGFFPCSEHVS